MPTSSTNRESLIYNTSIKNRNSSNLFAIDIEKNEALRVQEISMDLQVFPIQIKNRINNKLKSLNLRLRKLYGWLSCLAKAHIFHGPKAHGIEMSWWMPICCLILLNHVGPTTPYKKGRIAPKGKACWPKLTTKCVCNLQPYKLLGSESNTSRKDGLGSLYFDNWRFKILRNIGYWYWHCNKHAINAVWSTTSHHSPTFSIGSGVIRLFQGGYIFYFRLIWFLSTKRPSITWLFLWTARAVFLLAVNFTAIGDDKCQGSSTVYSALSCWFTHPFSPIAISCFLLIPVVTSGLFKEGHLPRPKVTLLRAGLCARVSDRTPGEANFLTRQNIMAANVWCDLQK